MTTVPRASKALAKVKAAQERRTPRRWREFSYAFENAKRHGVRRSCAALLRNLKVSSNSAAIEMRALLRARTPALL